MPNALNFVRFEQRDDTVCLVVSTNDGHESRGCIPVEWLDALTPAQAKAKLMAAVQQARSRQGVIDDLAASLTGTVDLTDDAPKPAKKAGAAKTEKE